MVQPFAALRDGLRHGAVRPSGRDELDPPRAVPEDGHPDLLARHLLHLGQLEAVDVPIEPDGGVEVGDQDGDVIETGHRLPLRAGGGAAITPARRSAVNRPAPRPRQRAPGATSALTTWSAPSNPTVSTCVPRPSTMCVASATGWSKVGSTAIHSSPLLTSAQACQ